MAMKYISLNPYYSIKPDQGRALMMPLLIGRNLLNGEGDAFTNIIHPIYAMILSFIDGRPMEECISDASEFLNVDEKLIENFVISLLDNPNKVKLISNGTSSVFPPKTIVTNDSLNRNIRYSPEQFDYDQLDMRMKRHLTPSAITLMLNNICMTRCIYCYQDKSRKVNCTIPLKRIVDLIHEAKLLNVNSFDVIGGEFFLYPYWKQVLKELRECGFNPYISTKMPLSEADVEFLKNVGLRDIQISLDTLIPDNLYKLIRVDEAYIEKMLETLALLDKAGIKIIVHSVLTRYNMTENDMVSIYCAIRNLKNVVDWHIVKGEPTLYPQVPYEQIEIPCGELNSIIDHIDGFPDNNPFTIHKPQKEHPMTAVPDKGSLKAREKEFFKTSRTYCSGLFSSLYILPDGDVTMCEQLYWNKDFIVGNILTHGIMEIWNSEKALSIYNISQEMIPEDSLCHSCEKFSVCREIRQVCYREIIRKYGAEKWYYPDVNCPYAISNE